MSHTRVNFSELEPEKENIAVSNEGKSASKLAVALALGSRELQRIKTQFESKIALNDNNINSNTRDSSQDADPLATYIEYMEWLKHAYPQGVSSKRSGALSVLERCLIKFKDDSKYSDDIRFLKLWISYIENFYADSPVEARNLYVFMYRNKIGLRHKLFYIEFSKLLFDMKRFQEGYHVLKRGVHELNMKEDQSLQKALREYEVALNELGIEIVDEQLVQLNDFFANTENPIILDKDRQSILKEWQASKRTGSNRNKGNSSKLQIFQDDLDLDPQSSPLDSELQPGWSELETKSERKKENEPLKQTLIPNRHFSCSVTAGAKPLFKDAAKKRVIFNDTLGRNGPIHTIVQLPNGKTEKLDCNVELLYDKEQPLRDPGSSLTITATAPVSLTVVHEFCIEELLARARGVYYNQLDRGSSCKKREMCDDSRNENEQKRVKV